MKTLDQFLPQGLFAISVLLLMWGALGLVEYAAPSIGFGLQNAAFPPGLQFIHFFALTLTGGLFAYGYASRWSGAPYATMTMYAVLATICFIETMDFGAFGGGAQGVTIMLMEFALYIGLSVYLHRSPAIRRRFRLASG